MGIINKIKRIKVFESKLRRSLVNSNDKYVRSEVIYNSEKNFIILLSYTNDYCNDAIELLATCSLIDGMNVKYIHSSYEEENDDKIIIHDKYYILIGGSSSAYVDLFKFSDNLANNILDCISLEIVNNRTSSDFCEIFDILNKSLFKYNDIKPKYDSLVRIPNTYSAYDDITYIMSKLPDGFTTQKILRFINCYDISETGEIEDEYITVYDMLNNAYNKNDSFYKNYIIDKYKDLIASIAKNPDDAVLSNFVGPQYLVQDDEVIPGNISNENLDELFQQYYDRFSAVASDDVSYEDIDEEITDENQE